MQGHNATMQAFAEPVMAALDSRSSSSSDSSTDDSNGPQAFCELLKAGLMQLLGSADAASVRLCSKHARDLADAAIKTAYLPLPLSDDPDEEALDLPSKAAAYHAKLQPNTLIVFLPVTFDGAMAIDQCARYAAGTFGHGLPATHCVIQLGLMATAKAPRRQDRSLPLPALLLLQGMLPRLTHLTIRCSWLDCAPQLLAALASSHSLHTLILDRQDDMNQDMPGTELEALCRVKSLKALHGRWRMRRDVLGRLCSKLPLLRTLGVGQLQLPPVPVDYLPIAPPEPGIPGGFLTGPVAEIADPDPYPSIQVLTGPPSEAAVQDEPSIMRSTEHSLSMEQVAYYFPNLQRLECYLLPAVGPYNNAINTQRLVSFAEHFAGGPKARNLVRCHPHMQYEAVQGRCLTVVNAVLIWPRRVVLRWHVCLDLINQDFCIWLMCMRQ